MSLPNRWHLRRVAAASSKACYICYKPTASVLITPDNKDFFYVCDGHLSDKGFCMPISDEDAAKKAAQEAKEKEIEKVKQEYEEKQKKKTEKKKTKGKEKDESKEKGEEGDDIKKDESGSAAQTSEEDKAKVRPEGTPRIFSLHKNFYQMRVDRLRNAEAAKRSRDRLKSLGGFPSVPTGGAI